MPLEDSIQTFRLRVLREAVRSGNISATCQRYKNAASLCDPFAKPAGSESLHGLLETRPRRPMRDRHQTARKHARRGPYTCSHRFPARSIAAALRQGPDSRRCFCPPRTATAGQAVSAGMGSLDPKDLRSRSPAGRRGPADALDASAAAGTVPLRHLDALGRATSSWADQHGRLVLAWSSRQRARLRNEFLIFLEI